MNNFTPSTQLEDNIQAAMAVPQAPPEFVNQLNIDLMQQVSLKNQKSLRPIYLRPAWIAFIAVLALLVVSTLIIGPQRVYAAVRQLFGYIPGVGIVEQSNGIRVLAESVSVKQDGITVTVKQVVADATRTFVVYRVEDIPSSDIPICTLPPILQLPDGRKLSFLSGGEGGIGSENGVPMQFSTNYTFPALPANVRKVMFLSPCQMPAIQLSLIPAPANFVTPAVEIEATSISSSPRFLTTPTPVSDETSISVPYEPSAPATPTPVPHGSGLYLDRVIELDNAYILVGNFTDAGDLPGVLSTGSLEGDQLEHPIQITDAAGQSLSYKARYDIRPALEWAGVWYWAYEIPKPVHDPLTLTIASIPVQQEDSNQFSLDVGQDPQLGQKWVLNRTISIGGYDFVFEDVGKAENGYTIHYHSETTIPEDVNLDLYLTGADPTKSPGSETRHSDSVIYSETLNFDDTPPAGNLTFLLRLNKIVQLPGPWKLTWTPPVP
jgi:Domain of unknown function (DUF4179)